MDGGRPTSSWGGAVHQRQTDGVFEMVAAEMTSHCGINSWTRNSRIVYATSRSASGPYTRQAAVEGREAVRPTG